MSNVTQEMKSESACKCSAAQLISLCTHPSLWPSQRQPSLSQPVCQRQTVFVNDWAMPMRQETRMEREKKKIGIMKREKPLIKQSHMWCDGTLPPEDVSFLPRHHTVCDCTATFLRGASCRRERGTQHHTTVFSGFGSQSRVRRRCEEFG